MGDCDGRVRVDWRHVPFLRCSARDRSIIAGRCLHFRLPTTPGSTAGRLDEVAGENFGEEPRFEIVYELYSMTLAAHLRLKLRVSEDAGSVDTVSDIWPTANWHEREIYDMMGIKFDGHPDLRRILMWDGYPFFPLRKEFPLEGLPSEMPDVAFTKITPMEGGPFVTVPSTATAKDREPRARPPELSTEGILPRSRKFGLPNDRLDITCNHDPRIKGCGTMKFCLPYWWLTRTRDQTKDVFFDYVKRRHALAKATTNRTNVSCIAPTDSPKGDDALNWIYGLLTILDAKASALMRLNGVMLAAAAFLLNSRPGLAVTRSIVISALGSTISIACCLLVVSIDWPFLGLVKTESGKLDFSDEFFHLQKVAVFRRRCYQFGWLISLLATMAFLFGIVIFFLHFWNKVT